MNRFDELRYPTDKPIVPQIPKSPNLSVGGIRLKILDKISYYQYSKHDNPLGYKKSALEELYEELFE